VRRWPGLIRRVGLLVSLWAIVVAAALVGSLGGPRYDRAVVNGLIMLILVVGLGVFVGTSGVFSFGHMSFMAIGAYTTAILTTSTRQKELQLEDLPGPLATAHVDPIVAVLVSGACAAVLALVLTIPLMRLSGLTASLATVAVLITVRVVLQNGDRYTRGTSGLILDGEQPSRDTVLVWALLAVTVAFAFGRSRVGRRLVASREDEVAARAVGIRVWWERGTSFVLSAFMVGAGGSLFALTARSINPDSFYLTITFDVIAMLVVGGLTSLSGAVIGTITISTLLELLREVERGTTVVGWDLPGRSGTTEVALAVVLLGVLALRPAGLTGGRELRLPRRWPIGARPPGEDQTPNARSIR
jgi:branched-chain amino acid transport system permease protein